MCGVRRYYSSEHPGRFVSRRSLEIELQCELNQPRVIACRVDAPEVARINNLSGGLINAMDGVEVADRVGEVDLVEEVEELCAELDVLRFAEPESV